MDDSFWIDALKSNETWLRRVLRNRLRNADEEDDVFQEVSLAVTRPELRPENRDKVAAWLYRVAIRQVLQYRRKAGRYQKLLRQSRDSSSPSRAGADPSVLLMRTERDEQIRAALSEMNETDREILMLKYAENWTYQQLADKLGVTKNTIEHRLVRAKKRLRATLTNNDREVT